MFGLSETTPKERKEAIRRAVGYNLPCDVWVESHGYPLHAKSRFFAVAAADQAPRILIEAPVHEGSIVPVRRGEDVDVYFRVDESRFTYRTTVLDRTEYRLRSGEIARAVETLYPRQVARGQKRDYYRIAIPRHDPIELQFGLLDSSVPDHLSTPTVLFRSRSEIVNLSASGLAFDLPEKRSLAVRPGERLLCEFMLPDATAVSLHGRVANWYRRMADNAVRYGVEFVDVEKAMNFKVARDQLLRFIVRFQRERLARRTGMHD